MLYKINENEIPAGLGAQLVLEYGKKRAYLNTPAHILCTDGPERPGGNLTVFKDFRACN
jgi:hypothetical protein